MFEASNNKKLLVFDSLKDKIFKEFIDKKLHHSCLFVGNKGIGKATLCYHIANKILNHESSLKEKRTDSLFEEIIEDKDLNDNNPTFNLIKNKKHPDLLVIKKEFDNKTSKFDKEIKVLSARKIMDFMSLAPFVSKNKVIIIDSVDEMNISAQNAILKVLEEPLKNTYIFLICHNSNRILDTINSRCKTINILNHNIENWKSIFKYVSEEKYKILKPEQLSNLYDLSNGSISLTLNILENDGLSLYNHIENILSEKILNIENLQNLAEELNNNEKLFNLFSDFILLFLYKVIKYFSIGNSNEIFKSTNFNFIIKNNEKSILDKIKFTKDILKDTNIYNLNKKHIIVVLFNNLYF